MEVSHERSRFEEAEAQRQKADEEKCIPSFWWSGPAEAQADALSLRPFLFAGHRRQQEFLISVISHELRNPVSAILQVSPFCQRGARSLSALILIVCPRDVSVLQPRAR
jgi:signal transduction histidine kinase